MTDKSISVVIPAYNTQENLGRCLEGLAVQSLLPREIIVVDDGSTDDTKETACSRGAICITNNKTKGPGGARNTGAEVAKGKILAFIDSDCIPPPNWLKELTAPFNDNEVAAVGSGYEGGADQGFWQRFCHEELAFRRRNMPGRVNTLVSNNFACRKKIFEEVGGFPEIYPVCEDMLLSYNIACRHRILWLETPKVIHHFKNSFGAFLKHQYYFGKESMFFFLKNPKVFAAANHQGRHLHFAILFAGASAGMLATTIILAALEHSELAVGGILTSGVMLGLHALLYRDFRLYLTTKKFHSTNKAYSVSLARDFACFISAFAGLKKYLFSRSNN